MPYSNNNIALTRIGHLCFAGGNTTFLLLGSSTGKVTMLGNPNSAYAAGSGIWATDDPMPVA